MYKKLFIKTLAVGVILLFLGIAIKPITSINITQDKELLVVENIEPKKYLFNTIIEIANTPEIKEILDLYNHKLFTSDYNYEGVFTQLVFKNPRLLFSLFFTKPSIAYDYLDFIYNNGIEVTNILGEDEAIDMMESAFIINPEVLHEINNVILNDEVLSNKISTLGEMNNELELYPSFNFSPIICVILATSLIPFILLNYWAFKWVFVHGPNPLITPIAMVIYYFTNDMIMILWSIGFEFKCWPPYSTTYR